jgi:tetratricopeptide (TPR) repeat protein
LRFILLRDHYFVVIDQIVDKILKGQLPSKAQVQQQLLAEIEPGTAEVLAACLQDRLSVTESLLTQATDELKQARASRTLRALKTIQGEWEHYQREQGASDVIAAATQRILSSPEHHFEVWVNVLDANQVQPLTLEQLQQFATTLHQALPFVQQDTADDVQAIILGIRSGLTHCRALEPHLIAWIYDQGDHSLGFGGIPGQQGPWHRWAQVLPDSLARTLFQGLALGQPVEVCLQDASDISLADWTALALVLQWLQRGLVSWLEQQPYDAKWGTQQAIATFLTFAVIGSQLSAITDSNNQQQGWFQFVLQILRMFTQRSYFPLYGGVFALLSSRHLQAAFNYLSQPLHQAEGTQEVARMLTLLGYSQRAMGQLEEALVFHEKALEIAQSATDIPCEIANLNHISRTYLAQTRYANAISYSQRALILARQRGDRLGEANALTNLGYAQILSAQQIERLIPEASEVAIGYLQEGLRLAEQLGDRQSQSLCSNSLGIAYNLLEQHAAAIPYLQQGLQAAQRSGDLYLQGLNWSYLAESYYHLGEYGQAVSAALLGLYELEQIQAPEYRQPAGLLRVLQGKLGLDAFQAQVQQCRATLLPWIGVDGYDHVLQELASLLN